MEAFEVEAERSELVLMLLQCILVLLTNERVIPVVHQHAVRNQLVNLPIQSLALLSESLTLIFLVNVHAPLRESTLGRACPVILDSRKRRILTRLSSFAY
jgi:hypothetical protein